MLLLKILKACVTEPAFVKTVSKANVSALVNNEASGLVMKESFLHEKRKRMEENIIMTDFKLFY